MHGAYEHFREGGWGMWPILFWSILTIGIIVERALFLFGSSINKDVFLATMQKCILAGDVAKAVKMCSAANAPLARIVQAGLVKVNRPDEEVQAAMDEAALREIPKIAKRTGYLALLANLAMLSGLLGTVSGLIVSFGADTWAGDPISYFKLQTEDYEVLARDIAAHGWPTVIAMEGGYAIDALGANVTSLLAGF